MSIAEGCSQNTGPLSGDGTISDPSRLLEWRRLEPGPPTSLLEDSPARTSVTPAVALGLMERVPDFGGSLPGSFAFFDPLTFSWRTCQRSLFEGYPEFSGIWPRSGLMRNGIVSRLPRLVPRIDDGESSFLPTPQASQDGRTPEQYDRSRVRRYERRKAKGTSRGGPSSAKGQLSIVVQWMYPTPNARDWKGTGEFTDYEKVARKGKLAGAVAMMYPTPRSDGRDNAGGTNSRRTAKANGTYIGRTLNPEFVEWLMGFPVGWTDLKDSETP